MIIGSESGKKAEQIALEYLTGQKLHMIYRNFHSRFGEIDLIMRDKQQVVFVEVRQRSSGIDHALHSITYTKQQKLIKTAQYFLLKFNLDCQCRFDVIAIDREKHITWLKNVIIIT